jgi:PEGA domain
LFTSHEPGSSNRALYVTVGVAVAVLALAALYFTLGRREAPPPAATTAPAPVRPKAPRAEETPKAEVPVEPASPASRTPRAPRPRPVAEAPAAPEAPAGPTLVVDSDVPGASVFVDRRYLGTTPLRTTDVTPGTHQVNASAEGQEGVARSVDIADTGETTVMLRFREVTLNASVPVVHKHAMGSCEGRLVADVNGLRYVTTNKGDAFTLPFGQLETFEVDYMQKLLKVKQRGGRTWNFTDKTANADALFVFHRDVTKARAKLEAAR